MENGGGTLVWVESPIGPLCTEQINRTDFIYFTSLYGAPIACKATLKAFKVIPSYSPRFRQ